MQHRQTGSICFNLLTILHQSFHPLITVKETYGLKIVAVFGTAYYLLLTNTVCSIIVCLNQTSAPV